MVGTVTVDRFRWNSVSIDRILNFDKDCRNLQEESFNLTSRSIKGESESLPYAESVSSMYPAAGELAFLP